MNKHMLIISVLVVETALGVLPHKALSLETLSLKAESIQTLPHKATSRKTLSIEASFLDASGATPKEEFYFHPLHKKKFKRVKASSKIGSFKSLWLKQQANKKRVFIDWRKLYWGTLRGLLHSEEEANLEESKNIQEISGTPVQETEEARELTRELRQELKSFAKHYGLKIVWQKKSLNLSDATAAFLDYWDRGMPQEEKDNVMPFSNLCNSSGNPLTTRNITLKQGM